MSRNLGNGRSAVGHTPADGGSIPPSSTRQMIDERPDISGLSVVSGLANGRPMAQNVTVGLFRPRCPMGPCRYCRFHARQERIGTDPTNGRRLLPGTNQCRLRPGDWQEASTLQGRPWNAPGCRARRSRATPWVRSQPKPRAGDHPSRPRFSTPRRSDKEWSTKIALQPPPRTPPLSKTCQHPVWEPSCRWNQAAGVDPSL